MQDSPPTLTGILKPNGLGNAFQLQRHTPSPDLAPLILRYWSIVWDLPEPQRHQQETLPYPCVNVTVQPGRSGVFGVSTQRFQAELSGQGWVFGIKFRPGAFYPFYRTPISELTDRVMSLEHVFGAAGVAYEQRLMECSSIDEMIGCAEAFLRAQMPAPDPQVELINAIVDRIADDRSITRVAMLATQFGVSQRTLQRLFNLYVGIGPKWIIRRYRLIEAAELLAQGAPLNLANLAQTLGYFDQAHFINDFRAAIGDTPAAYAER